MNLSLSKREINRQRWLERIRAWKQSGQTQRAFCQQHHLGLASFQRWRRKLRVEKKPEESSTITFLPVSVKNAHASNLTLRVNDHLHIEIPSGFDPNTLKQVIDVLQAS